MNKSKKCSNSCVDRRQGRSSQQLDCSQESATLLSDDD